MASWKLFLVVLPLFLLLDFVWIGLIMKGFYNEELGDLARRHAGALAPRWGAAILVYVIIPVGIVLFVRPAMGAQAGLFTAFLWGAIFGLIAYGIYDLTNLAVLDKWSVRMTAMDMTWGGAICGVSALWMRAVERWQ
jgi:uncharacterized membrane protein